jgi:hypothetical protein
LRKESIIREEKCGQDRTQNAFHQKKFGNKDNPFFWLQEMNRNGNLKGKNDLLLYEAAASDKSPKKIFSKAIF